MSEEFNNEIVLHWCLIVKLDTIGNFVCVCRTISDCLNQCFSLFSWIDGEFQPPICKETFNEINFRGLLMIIFTNFIVKLIGVTKRRILLSAKINLVTVKKNQRIS